MFVRCYVVFFVVFAGVLDLGFEFVVFSCLCCGVRWLFNCGFCDFVVRILLVVLCWFIL